MSIISAAQSSTVTNSKRVLSSGSFCTVLMAAMLGSGAAAASTATDAETFISQYAGETVFVETSIGNYLRAKNGGGGKLDGKGAAQGEWEQLRVVDNGDGTVALRCASGHYMVAENGGGGDVNCNRTAVGPWESFTPVQVEVDGSTQWAFQTSDGDYVVAERGGNDDVNGNRSRIGAWETFQVHVDVDFITAYAGQEVLIQTSSDTYLRAVNEGGYELDGRGTGQNAERLGVVDNGDGTFAFQCASGHYMVAQNGGGGDVSCNATAVGSWESFTPVQIATGDSTPQWAFQSASGHYMVAERGGGDELNCDRTAIGPWEQFLVDKWVYAGGDCVGCDLSGADLTDAVLRNTNFAGADLTDVIGDLGDWR